MHRLEPGSARVTRAVLQRLVDGALGEQLEYQGLATLVLLDETGGLGSNVTLLHYRVRNEPVERTFRPGMSPAQIAKAKRTPLLGSAAPPH